MKIRLLAFLILVPLGAACYGQPRSCDLKLLVQINDGYSIRSLERAVNFSASLTNTETKSVSEASFKDGVPYFVGVTDGSYLLSVEKLGFWPLEEQFPVKCTANPDGTQTKTLTLLPYRFSRDSVRTAQDKNPSLPPPPTGNDTGKQPGIFELFPYAEQTLGTLNAKAVHLGAANYPEKARQSKIQSDVDVSVVVDEKGNVIFARWLGGHAIFRESAEKAAMDSKIEPLIVDGKPSQAIGILVFKYKLGN